MKFVNAHLVEYTPDRWLAFDDVLLMPQHSRINSRKDKSLDTSTNLTENVRIHVPIVSSPMDCVTEGNMAVGMIGAGGAGILHRFYKGKYGDNARSRWEQDVLLMIEKGGLPIFSVGASPEDMEPVEWVLKQSKRAVVCVDIAHGHLQKAMDQVRRLRTTFGPSIEIVGGSITSPEAAMHMIQAGCSALRVGVGAGCFTPDTQINTEDGQKSIIEIKEGDRVLTHDGTFQKVIGTTSRLEDTEVTVINDDIKCTNNHEFYVLHKDCVDMVSDGNLSSFAEWISAENLTEDYLLIQIQ